MGHNVGAKAENAVKKSEKVKASERTPEQVIADIRRNLAANLAVTPGDQRWLLEQFDVKARVASEAFETILKLQEDVRALEAKNASQSTTIVDLHAKVEEISLMTNQVFDAKIAELNALNASQSTMIVDLHAKLQEFREVYELENRSTTLRVDTLSEPLPPTSTEA